MYLICYDEYELNMGTDPRCSCVLKCSVDLVGMWGSHQLPLWAYRVNRSLATEARLRGDSVYNSLTHFVQEVISSAPCSSNVVIESRIRNTNWKPDT